jgi:DNA-binding transcriptional LysR family regulator
MATSVVHVSEALLARREHADASPNWRGLEIRHLTALKAVAEEQSFSRAAARLGYTQSAVSQQIAALERTIGHRMLERRHGGRRVALTDAGRIVLEHAEAIASELAATHSRLHALGKTDGLTFTVGVPAANGAYWLPAVIADAGPELFHGRLRVFEMTDDRGLVTSLRSGELDLAFLPGTALSPGFESIDLPRDHYAAVALADEAAVLARQGCTLATLAKRPLLLQGARARRELTAVCETRGLTLQHALESDNPALLSVLVAQGLGVAILPRLALPPAPGGVEIVPVEDMPPRTLTVAWNSRLPEPGLRPHFVDAAVRVFSAALQCAHHSAKNRK